MAGQKISGKALISDIQAGLNYTALKAKYNLTDAALDSAFQKLVTAGLLQYEELPEKPSSTCPKCGLPLEEGVVGCRGCAIVQDVFRGEDYQIALKDFVADVRAKKGFEDVRLRYLLSEDQLRKVLAGLLAAGTIKESENPGTYGNVSKPQRSNADYMAWVRSRQHTDQETLARDKESSPPGLFCPKCGEKRIEGANFCARCGNQLQAPSAGARLDSERHDSLVPSTACPSCGATQPGPIEVCRACGVNVSKWRQLQRRKAIMALFPQQTPTAEMFAKQLSSAPDFMPSAVVIGADQKTGLAVDYERSKVCLLGPGDQSRTLPSSYILSCEITEERRTMQFTTGKKSPVLRGIGGFLVAGPVGAMLGGMSGLSGGQESTSWEEVRNVQLEITTKDPYYPNFVLNFVNHNIRASSDAYRNALQYALQWKGALENLSQQILR